MPPIKTEADYEAALERIKALSDRGTPRTASEEVEFDTLISTVYDYEEKNFPMDIPSPEDMARFRAEQEGGL